MQTLALIAAALLAPAQTDQVKFDYASFRGLRATVGETTVIDSSGFQFYEPGWKQGYFSSAWKPLDVLRQATGSTLVRIQGDNGRVLGTIRLTPQDSGFDLTYDLVWHGDKPARIELAVARLWAPYIANGTLTQDGLNVPYIDLLPGSQGSTKDRALGRPSNQVVFDAPGAKLTFASPQRIECLDARQSQAEWAKGKELVWVGFTDVVANPHQPVRFQVAVRIEPTPRPASRPPATWTKARPLTTAFLPEPTPFPLVPKPKSVTDSPGAIDCHKGLLPNPSTQEQTKWLHAFLSEHWDWNPSEMPGLPVTVTHDPSLPPEGYDLATGPAGVTVRSSTPAGTNHAFRTLALLVRPRAGRLTLPITRVRDWPSLSWRGIHCFVGPQALPFQTALIDNVLTVGKFNKVVLECSRTAWDATPGTATSVTVSKPVLAALVAKYRQSAIEPIPLVQSLGHMEWLFANGQNLELAVNPQIPYTIDPRKKASQDLLASVWQEALQIFNPSTVHFGLDEIDNRGLPDEPHFATRMWATHLPFLLQIAQQAKVKPMVWSDMMLHRSEAPDAAGAESPEIARQRRAALPKGTIVGDWHYKADPNPAAFKSLALWKNLGMFPVATSWNRPANIRGQALASIAVAGGHLQSTWAGYESNEANMVKNLDQFSAYLIAADYAWSGKTEMPDKLGYDPVALFERLYFANRAILTPKPGVTVSATDSPETRKIGSVYFAGSSPVQLFGVTSTAAFNAPDSVVVQLPAPASKIALAIDCLARVTDGDPVATVEFRLPDGRTLTRNITYGTHVRAVTDNAKTYASARVGTVSAVVLDLSTTQATQLTVRVTNPSVGVRIHGVTAG